MEGKTVIMVMKVAKERNRICKKEVREEVSNAGRTHRTVNLEAERRQYTEDPVWTLTAVRTHKNSLWPLSEPRRPQHEHWPLSNPRRPQCEHWLLSEPEDLSTNTYRCLNPEDLVWTLTAVNTQNTSVWIVEPTSTILPLFRTPYRSANSPFSVPTALSPVNSFYRLMCDVRRIS
jgi:hypothetical protein